MLRTLAFFILHHYTDFTLLRLMGSILIERNELIQTYSVPYYYLKMAASIQPSCKKPQNNRKRGSKGDFTAASVFMGLLFCGIFLILRNGFYQHFRWGERLRQPFVCGGLFTAAPAQAE